MKNLIYVVLGLGYFSYYFYITQYYPENNIFLNVDKLIYGEELFSYFNGIMGFFTSLGLIGFINKSLEKLLIKIFSKTENGLDDLFGTFIIKFIKIAKYVFALYIGFYLAIIPHYIQLVIDRLSSVSIIIIFLVLMTSFINSIFENELMLKSKLKAVSQHLYPFINKVIVVGFWILGIITIIGNLGYDVTALVAGAGIGGLAVALAAQKSLSNIFGAITIIVNKPFKIGDFVNIGGNMGTVKDIGLTYLTLTDKMGHQVMIPNENIISGSIENYSVRTSRRTDFILGLEYATTEAKMNKGVSIVEKLLETYVMAGTIKSYRVNFDGFGDFSLNINVTYFSLINNDYKEYIKQKEEINLTIKKEFKKEKIEMAFPTQELIIKK